MKIEANEVEINGVVYVPKGLQEAKMAEKVDNMAYVIVRTYSAGVFAGYFRAKDGDEVVLLNARRLWYWSGAASLSQLAMEGVKNPKACKFPCEVKRIQLLGVIEIIDCTKQAKQSIAGVPIWEA